MEDARAHSPPSAGAEASSTGVAPVDALMAGVLLLLLAGYCVGSWRRMRHPDRVGMSLAPVSLFLGGFAVLTVALVSPLDTLGDRSLAAHMSQHMLLMALAPPLLLLGRPGTVLPAALPAGLARRLMRLRRGLSRLPCMTVLATPAAAALVQAAVTWGWHLPSAMAAALHSESMHYAMHASFLAAGLLFWHSLMRARPASADAGGAVASMAALVATMMQMGLLGALLTFAGEARYADYALRAVALGLDPLEDQQLAGLIMWVPSAVPYLVGGLVLMAGWMRRAERAEKNVARV